MEECDRVNIISGMSELMPWCPSAQQFMTNICTSISDLPPEQRAIRDKCLHPTGRFVEFKKEEIEQSIPDRFEQMVRMYPDRLAIETKTRAFTHYSLKPSNLLAKN